MTVSNNPSRALALAAFVLAAGAYADPASATIYRDTSSGGACKPAAAGSTAFTFGNTYLLNKSATPEYVICHFDMLDFGFTYQVPEQLDVFFQAGATAGTATCVVQIGYYWNGLTNSSVVARNSALGAGGVGYASWVAADFTRNSVYHTLTLNCKVPPSWKMGLIQRRDKDPMPGTAWVPAGT